MVAVANDTETIRVETELHLVAVRNRVRGHAKEVGFGIVDETKLVTAASELSRNMVLYAGGGEILIEKVVTAARKGLRITFSDSGPGIEDLDLAMSDGYSTNGSLGLGLPGSKRLVCEFEISSRPGEGTRVTFTKWK